MVCSHVSKLTSWAGCIAVMEKYGSVIAEHVDSFKLSRRGFENSSHFAIFCNIRTHEDSTPAILKNLLHHRTATLNSRLHLVNLQQFR